MHRRGIIAYGKHLFGGEWEFPKSDLYPKERFRYLNGGLQLWTKEGRHKSREHFTSIDDYVLKTRFTEQCYINLQLSQPVFNVRELDTKWNRMTYQSFNGRPDGKITHFLHRTKFEMPRLEKRRVWDMTTTIVVKADNKKLFSWYWCPLLHKHEDQRFVFWGEPDFVYNNPNVKWPKTFSEKQLVWYQKVIKIRL